MHGPEFPSARSAARWLVTEHRRAGHQGELLIALYRGGQFVGTLRHTPVTPR